MITSPSARFVSLALFLGIAAYGCVAVKTTSLYPESTDTGTADGINGFRSTHIFEDYLSTEIWHTEQKSCIEVENIFDGQKSGKGALHIKWNKPQGGCTWIGMGIGWDDWYAKDMHRIMDAAAIQFYVKNVTGETKGLPWAIGLEDYSNAQAWTGMTPNYIDGGVVKETWTKVTIPLSTFELEVQDPDLYSIKQIIFQFEGDGNVMIDEIEIVPFSGSLNKQALVERTDNFSLDGVLSANEKWSKVMVENSEIYLSYDQNNLYVMSQISDANPFNNSQSGENIWNGDALEIAFSTNANALPRRKQFLLSDKHIGMSLDSKMTIWDWSSDIELTNVQKKIMKTNLGCKLEVAIPWNVLGVEPWEVGKTYGLEIAVDNADATGVRKTQTRWNNNYTEGFHQNPSMWGSMKIVDPIVHVTE